MKAIRVNLTFFYDEAKLGEQEIKARLEKLLIDEFPEVRDRDLHWQEAPTTSAKENLEAHLERLDT